MAETELAPWLAQPSEQTELAPWLKDEEKKPTVTQDVAKAAGPSLLRGTLGAMTIPGTLFDAVAKGGAWAAHKIAPEATKDFDMGKTLEQAHKIYPKIPSYSAALKGVEHVTGPMYQAETGPGKAFQGTLEVAPQLAIGGGGVLPTAVKAIGAGTGGELAREGAEWLKPHLPASVQPYAEPVGQALGTVLGGGAASAARRGVTPNPMTDEQLATVTALKGEGFPMTAGQATQSPNLRALEGRTGGVADSMPAAQEQHFTNQAMQQMGSGGRFNDTNLKAGEKVGDELGNLRRSNQINPQEYANLVTATRAAQQKFARDYGANNTADMDAASALIRHTTPALNMPGTRYDMIRGQLQGMIENAATPQAAHELAGLRQHLDQAFYNSLPADAAARAKELQNQYVNYSTLSGIKPNVGRETVTPQEVLSAVSSKSGRRAANQEQGSLAPYAQQAGRVMSEIPHRSTEISPVTDATGTLLSALAGGGAGAALSGAPGAAHGLEAGVFGHLALPGVVNTGKDVASMLVNRPKMQKYLGNQIWRPGANTSGLDQATLIRLLMSPQNAGLLH